MKIVHGRLFNIIDFLVCYVMIYLTFANFYYYSKVQYNNV